MAGLNEILKNLNKEIAKIEGGTLKGLRKASLLIQSEAQEITPHDKGFLVNDAFSDAQMTDKGPVARIGYTKKYAPFVHEMPETNNFSKPGTGPKFLQKAVSQNAGLILEIIAKEAKI